MSPQHRSGMTPGVSLDVSGLGHAFGARPVLDGLDFTLDAGRTLALVGPSGCGKTTALNLVAGLLTLQDGRIEGGFARPACVFQQPRLLPWKTALDNVALGLKALGVARAERERRSRELAQRMGLGAADLALYPAALSGGMQSRVALARALAIEPDLLLLDEPFGALDIGLRAELHAMVQAEQRRRGMAVLLITHDLAEAMKLADELRVMAAPGRVVWAVRPGRTPAARDDAWIAGATAALLAEPAVRSAFGLPPPSCPVANDDHGFGGEVVALAAARTRRHSC